MRRSVRLGNFLLLAVAWVAGGCAGEKGATVNGTVLLDGVPLPGAQVQMIPQSDQDIPLLSAATDADGHFTIHARPHSGKSAAGRYLVLVSKTAMKSPTSMDLVEVVPPLYHDRARRPSGRRSRRATIPSRLSR